MQTYEPAPEQWPQFLQKLADHHCGENITLHAKDPAEGTIGQTHSVRLVSIAFEAHDAFGEEIDVVVASDESPAEMLHALKKPTHVTLSTGDDGSDRELTVETDQGRSMLIRFNLPQA